MDEQILDGQTLDGKTLGGKTFRVLLIEDEPVIRELVRVMLSGGGVEVECVTDGTEGIRVARQKQADLILLDIVLPGLDGITICRLLRSDPSTSRIPIYMLTAKAKAADVDAAKRAGATGYIQKPFRGAELMDLVEKLRLEPRTP